ncbi:tetratricopeptide repeat protein [Candidatus Microgenomates bacterium]|nr:MAG: tetratricopeptide repeat protein [Candidatus Microgenomates bacterium]
MDPQRINLAIKAALDQNWKEAIRLNQELLEQEAEDIAALNRLAYAYIKTGSIASAKTTYKKVLKIDHYNPIALKNLKWLNNISKQDIQKDTDSSPSPTIFIEEPGKTKVVTLVNPAPIKTLCNVMTAQKVVLHPKKFTIEIRTTHNVYLGALPDDIAHRLLKFIAGGNTYDVYIKNIQKNVVTVFIKESKRGRKFTQYPSFSNSLPSRVARKSDKK